MNELSGETRGPRSDNESEPHDLPLPELSPEVQRLRDSARAEARYHGLSEPTEEALNEMEQDWTANLSEVGAIEQAVEGASGLVFSPDGRLRSSGLPATRGEQLSDNPAFVAVIPVTHPSVSIADTEAVHFALRGGLGTPLSIDELLDSLERVCHARWEYVLWSAVLEGDFAVDIHTRPYRFRFLQVETR